MNYNSACRKGNDSNEIKSRDTQSNSHAAYQLFNPHANKNYDNIIDSALKHPNLIVHEGYGTGEKVIDDDSLLRNGSMSTANGHKTHEYTMPIMMPYRGMGQGDPVIERRILESEPTSSSKPCGDHARVDWYTLSKMPTVDNLQSCLQNPKYIIPEDSDPYWVRGGIPSRTAVRSSTTKRFPWDK